MTDIEDLLTTLLRRRSVLEQLAGGTQTKPELVDALSVSRSTVDRAVDALEQYDAVERRSEGIDLTLVGRLWLTLVEGVETLADDVDDASSVLAHLAPSARFSLQFLRGAEVHLPASAGPNRPLEVAADLVREAESLVGTVLAVSQPRFPRLLHDEVVEGGLRAELVYDRRLVDEVLPDRTDRVAEMVRHGFRALSAADLSYTLLVARSGRTARAAVAVYDDGALVGVLANDDPGAVRWALATYADVRRRAVDITPAFRQSR